MIAGTPRLGRIASVAAALLALGAAPAPRGPWGFDLSGRDLSVKPGDDFWRYANGGWAARAVIPSDKPALTVATDAVDVADARLRLLIEAEAAKADAQPATTPGKIGAFYRSFMDTAHIDSLGVSPVSSELDAIRHAASRADLAALAGTANASFHGGPFIATLAFDQRAPGRYALVLGQGGLNLPDRNFYSDARFTATRAAYAAYVEQLLRLADWPDPARNAAAIVALETRIAAASWSKLEQRDWNAAYNPMSPADLAAAAPGFDWHVYLAAAQLGGVRRLIIGERTAFPRIAAAWSDTPVAVLRAWMAFAALDHAAPYLSQPYAAAFFKLHRQTLGGVTAPPPRWKSGVRAVSGGDYLAGDHWDRFGNMGWAVGQLYTARYFTPASKAAIESLVGHIRRAYRERLARNDWMSPATRAEALRKFDGLHLKVGYPEVNRDYSGLVVRADDLAGNVRRAAAWDWQVARAKLDRPVDPREWTMTPQTVNAYHEPWLRDIVFPAGILQAPLFDADSDPAVNYGSIGATIAHEITHAFDDQGRTIDAEGRLRDWWTPADAEAFRARAALLAAQYSAYQPLPGLFINGPRAQGEAMADLTGLAVALDAYGSAYGHDRRLLGGYTGVQRVFLGQAQFWRGVIRDDALRTQVTAGIHPPRPFRTNGVVRNLDGWYAAFAVQTGDTLYLPPAERVRIW